MANGWRAAWKKLNIWVESTELLPASVTSKASGSANLPPPRLYDDLNLFLLTEISWACANTVLYDVAKQERMPADGMVLSIKGVPAGESDAVTQEFFVMYGNGRGGTSGVAALFAGMVDHMNQHEVLGGYKHDDS